MMRPPTLISLRTAALAVAGGLLGAAAFAPLALWPCCPVSLALLLTLLRPQPARSAGQVGLLDGLAYPPRLRAPSRPAG